MTLRVVHTIEADDDMHVVWMHIAEDSLQAADNWYDRILAKCSLLAKSPFLGASCEHYAANLRLASVDNYAIFYRVESDAIVVVRVVHGSRDIERFVAINSASNPKANCGSAIS